MPQRPGSSQQTANNTYGTQATQSYNNAQGDLTQASTDQANLRSGKMVGADPYLNPQYLAAVNKLRSGALDQQNNAADAQIRSNQVRTGGENSTATNGAISNLALQKMRLGNQLGAEQTAGDWTKNIGYQLNLAQQPLQAAGLQTGLYSTAQRGQSSALNDLTQEDLANMQLAASAISATGGAAGGAACPAEGSLYLMADGSEKPVESLAIGDRIAGLDDEAQEIEGIQSSYHPCIRVVTENGCRTRNSWTHAFASPGDSFTLALESFGMFVMTALGPSRVIRVEPAGVARVFSVLTKGSHSYRADGVWAYGVGHVASDEACERLMKERALAVEVGG
jgi:hypothetical protein